MKKILIIGNCGSGKSTLAELLGEYLGLSVVHLDHLFWLPGWVERDLDDFDHLLKKDLKKPSWVMDGNYSRTLPMRLQYADTVIQLRFSRWVCLWRALKRKFFEKKEQAPGCPQRASLKFLYYVLWKHPRRAVPIAEKYQQDFPNVNWIILQSNADLQAFVGNLQKTLA